MFAKKILVLGLVSGLVAGCYQTAGDPGPREGVGTVAGAVAGGLLGSTIGSGSGRVAATVGGAVLGGVIGNRIGNSMDEQARREAYLAEARALEYGAPGTPVAWRSQAYYGTVTPGAYSERPGHQRCREYAHTIYINGQPETARGVACRTPDGSWAPV
ncbi:glycine zipper 2TM domain-containing protein [Flaviflagellibacter deserti]|uniref:17 kDa surface antigen n=1 Tax=Flaviflagellibacter deserti TaxID=2267266 RepID=A0ABV9YYE8_9HYPH